MRTAAIYGGVGRVVDIEEHDGHPGPRGDDAIRVDCPVQVEIGWSYDGQTWTDATGTPLSEDFIADWKRYTILPHCFYRRLTQEERTNFRTSQNPDIRDFWDNLFVLRIGIISDDPMTAQVRGLLTLLLGADRAEVLLAPMTVEEKAVYGDPSAAQN